MCMQSSHHLFCMQATQLGNAVVNTLFTPPSSGSRQNSNYPSGAASLFSCASILSQTFHLTFDCVRFWFWDNDYIFLMCEHGLIIGNVYVWDLRHSCYLILVVNSECACSFMWCYGFGCEIFGYMYICMNMYVNSVDKKKRKRGFTFFWEQC